MPWRKNGPYTNHNATERMRHWSSSLHVALLGRWGLCTDIGEFCMVGMCFGFVEYSVTFLQDYYRLPYPNGLADIAHCLPQSSPFRVLVFGCIVLPDCIWLKRTLGHKVLACMRAVVNNPPIFFCFTQPHCLLPSIPIILLERANKYKLQLSSSF